ncbi:MAG: hypothetical protein AB7L71_01195 [Vicinamibacterales bacterium]
MYALSEDVEEWRDERWCRAETRLVETAQDAERFVERVGFSACLTDARRPGPSLYMAVCGRRDAVMPRNVQKDPEASLTWTIKDEVLRRGKVYYGKLAKGKATFLAPRMIPHFNALWGVRQAEEKRGLSADARKLLKALRKEWELSSIDLRTDSGVTDRQTFTRALDELQAAMIVVPSDVVYQPKSPTSGRWRSDGFPISSERRSRVTRRLPRSRAASCKVPAPRCAANSRA